MSTGTDTSTTKKDSSVAVAIILPTLFAVTLIILAAIALLIPRLAADSDPAAKEERRKKRLARLDSSVKAEHYIEWATKQRHFDPETPSTIHALCVICLEDFSSDAQIRGLGCLHVFHQECLDNWFGRWNEYCPLCHRPIIQGLKPVKKIRREGVDLPLVGLIV